MIIKAIIKLQACNTKTARVPEVRILELGQGIEYPGWNRRAFVSCNYQEHGIARGRIELFEVEGDSWAGIRRTLHLFDVMGYSGVRPDTVESFTTDIGTARRRLSRLEVA